jgi:dihydroflavonol-4-reductase
MSILVTGASGFVGTHLVTRLVHEGHQVYSLVRKTSRVDALRALDTELVYGEVRDQASLAAVFTQHPEITTVFHLASVLTPVSAEDAIYWETNYEGTRHLLDVCCETGGVQAFVQCSSVGVIGPLPQLPADERTRCAPDSAYGASKYQAEQLALEYGARGQLPVTVVRPAWVYGPGDRRTYKFFRMVAGGRFFLIGDGQTQLSPVYVDDVVQGLTLAAEQIDRAADEVLIVSGGVTVSLETLATTIARAAGSSLLPIKVPAGLAKLGATMCESLCKPLGLEPPIHHRRLDFFFRDQAFDINKIRQTLGFRPAVALEDGVQRTVQWYREHEWL